MSDFPNHWTITVSRQMGSLGREIASTLGKMLDYRVVWREVINQAARRAGAPEAALAAIDELGLLGVCPSPQACLAYREAVTQVMLELADEGKVIIIGRAGQIILGGRPNILHVRLVAPIQVRVKRIAEWHHISIEAAHTQIEASDRFRQNYLKRFYHVRWDAAELYDLVINTGSLDAPGASALIAEALHEHQISRHREPSIYPQFDVESNR
jgi:cytidylate kinase